MSIAAQDRGPPIGSSLTPPIEALYVPPAKRRAGSRKAPSTNPNSNPDVLDAPEALRASPDATSPDERMDVESAGLDVDKQIKSEDDSGISALPSGPKTEKRAGKAKANKGANLGSKETSTPTSAGTPKVKKETNDSTQFLDPEADEDEEADEAELQSALSRPPQVHSDYLPLPWKGRLGYVGKAHHVLISH